ncbi:unnamed protein product [Closterium sp. NIES-54]
MFLCFVGIPLLVINHRILCPPVQVQVLQHDPYAAAMAASYGPGAGVGAGDGGFGAGATLASQYTVAADPGYGAGAGRRSTLR